MQRGEEVPRREVRVQREVRRGERMNPVAVLATVMVLLGVAVQFSLHRSGGWEYPWTVIILG